jgi:hypothetical protein
MASEPDDGFFYLRFSDENEEFVYTEIPKARVPSILRGNLDDEEDPKALKWLNAEKSEAFASDNDDLCVLETRQRRCRCGVVLLYTQTSGCYRT